MCIETNRFVERFHHDLICAICLGALCLNSVTDADGHTYCKHCICKWLDDDNERCPLGNEAISNDDFKPIPRIVKNILSTLQVYCKYKDLGCNQVVNYENIASHELGCPNNPNKRECTVYKEFKTPISVIKSSKSIELQATNLLRMVLSKDKTCLFITDEMQSSIHISDLDGNFIDSINPEGLLNQPIGICLNSYKNNDEIFVGDYYEHEIFVFDSNFKYIRKFGDENLKNPQYLYCDTHANSGILYVSDFQNNNITVWSIDDGSYIDIIELQEPFEIKFTTDMLFVSSPCSFDIDETIKNKVTRRTSGEDCIYVIDKFSFSIQNRIKLDNWLTVRILHMDSDLNLYITAYEIDENQIKSESKYLFTIDCNDQLVNKCLINDLQSYGDALLFEKNLIICSKKCIKLIKYE